MKRASLLLVAFAACSPGSAGLPGDAGADARLDASSDAGATDSATRDGGARDTGGATDAGTTDTGAADSAGMDSAVMDTGIPGCMWGGRPAISDSPLTDVSGRRESVTVGSFHDEYLYDSTGMFKVGVRKEWGSSVVFFGFAGSGPGMNGTNTIDANDTGREVQVAVYDPDRRVQGCSWNASCAASLTCPNTIRYLGWNPVQGGNRCNIGSPTESVSMAHGALVATTVPLQWNPDWEAPECVSDSCGSSGAASRVASDVRLTQRMRFVSLRVVELDYTLENLSDVAHAPTLQEMPTMYTANGRGGPDLWRLMQPDGTQVAIDTPAGSGGFMYKNFSATGPWVSLQNDDLSYGVGILYENGLRDFQGWQQRSLPFNNVRSRISFGLPARGTVRARAYLLLGSLDTIRADANALMARMAPFGVLDAPAGDVSAGPTTLRGWALDNRGVTSVEARIDETTTIPLRHGDPRPDVCRVWPGYPGCDAVGYSGSYDFGAPRACPHLVEIIATDTDGNRRTIAERLVTVR